MAAGDDEGPNPKDRLTICLGTVTIRLALPVFGLGGDLTGSFCTKRFVRN